VNYYRRYVGDYLRDTSTLSVTEHGAYTVMLDYYYADERPLPLDRAEVFRMVRAFKPLERRAVERVLGLYFERREDGYHNVRADEELSVAAPAIARARENGRKGGRRPGNKNPLGSTAGTQHEPTGLQTGVPSFLPTGQHPPSSNHQETTKSTTLSGSWPDPLGLSPPKSNGKGHGASHEEAEAVLAYLNRATGHAYRFRNPKGGKLSPNGQVIVARMAEGYTGEQLREVVHLKAEQWRADMKMAQYLRPKTLFGRENFSQYLGELGAVSPS